MSQKPENPSAFPQGISVGDVARSEGGMTLRDYFAAAAMQGLLSSLSHPEGGFNPFHPATVERVSATAYDYAEAMLRARVL